MNDELILLIIFAVAVLVVGCILILLLRCAIKKCSGSSKPKSDVEVTKIEKSNHTIQELAKDRN